MRGLKELSFLLAEKRGELNLLVGFNYVGPLIPLKIPLNNTRTMIKGVNAMIPNAIQTKVMNVFQWVAAFPVSCPESLACACRLLTIKNPTSIITISHIVENIMAVAAFNVFYLKELSKLKIFKTIVKTFNIIRKYFNIFRHKRYAWEKSKP